ncbi:MAG TPA: CAP domain-containing protein [Opitutaceae bacterium]
MAAAGTSLAVAALAAALLASCAHAPSPPGEYAAFDRAVSLDDPDTATLATAIFAETNRVRAENGVSPLRRVGQLDTASDEQALHMALTLHLEHSNPLPGEETAAARVTRTGFQAAHVAENAVMWPARPPVSSGRGAYTYAQLAAALVESWMNSPGHRLNLLDPGSTCVGCAARFARNGLGETMVFATQEFALPAPGGIGQN